MMAVKQWPAYLLRNIPADTRAAMTSRAEADDMSLADVVRAALCHRYRQDCDQVSYGYQHDLDSSNDALIIRVQPEIWKLLKKETGGRYGYTRHLILKALDDYLKEQAQ